MKYGNKKCVLGGIKYDSLKEGKRGLELHQWQKDGKISELKMQVPFKFELNGVKICKYIADFQYIQNSQLITEDVKGYKTEIYKLKKKLLKAFYNIDILET